MRSGSALRREFVSRLEAAGLPRARPSRDEDSGSVTRQLLQLIAVLETMGPVFVSFGRFLAHRADWFSWPACEALGRTRMVAAPRRAEVAREAFARSLGRQPSASEIQVAWDRPHVGLLGQWHKGRLGDGARVVVRLVEPSAMEKRTATLEALGALEARIPGLKSRPIPWSDLIASFGGTLDRELDLNHQAVTLQTLGSLETSEAIGVPHVYESLSSSCVLVHQRFESTEGVPDPSGRLYWWLRTALTHGVVAIDWLSEAPLLALPSGQLALVRGPFSALDDRERAAFREYLSRVAADDAEGALLALQVHWRRADRLGRWERSELQRRFRRIVPFRDSQWPGPPESMAGTVISHWRILRSLGIELTARGDSFLIGIAIQARRALQEAPHEDVLRASCEQLRADEIVEVVARWSRPSFAIDWLQQQGEPLSQLPAKIDRRLDRWRRRESAAAAEGEIRRGSPSHGDRVERVVVVATNGAALLVLVDLVLGVGAPAAWTQAVLALATALLGGGLLWLAARE